MGKHRRYDNSVLVKARESPCWCTDVVTSPPCSLFGAPKQHESDGSTVPQVCELLVLPTWAGKRRNHNPYVALTGVEKNRDSQAEVRRDTETTGAKRKTGGGAHLRCRKTGELHAHTSCVRVGVAGGHCFRLSLDLLYRRYLLRRGTRIRFDRRSRVRLDQVVTNIFREHSRSSSCRRCRKRRRSKKNRLYSM